MTTDALTYWPKGNGKFCLKAVYPLYGGDWGCPILLFDGVVHSVPCRDRPYPEALAFIEEYPAPGPILEIEEYEAEVRRREEALRRCAAIFIGRDWEG